ncbi:MAG TPA: hypothetical protein PKE45_23010, partial [Caldilineaceae bacterium]|nr:hypothetical protein [Caldilineaceae bacterium]
MEDKSDMAALRVAISLLMAARDTGRSIGLQPHQTIARGQDLSPCKSPRRLTLNHKSLVSQMGIGFNTVAKGIGIMQSIATLQSQVSSSAVQQARRGLALYFAVLVPITALLEAIMIRTGTFAPCVLFLMFTPMLASVIARLTLREGFGDVSFRLGGRRGVQAILLALILPVIVGLVAYGVAWSVGLAEFTPPDSSTFPAVTNRLARLGLQFVSVLNIGFLIALVLAAEKISSRCSW